MAVSSVSYLQSLVLELGKTWPENRTVNIVCHGHSVPAGYFQTPFVDTFGAYPHVLHMRLKERFPFAVLNVITTAVGGETSDLGAARFDDVVAHRPDLLTIDYALNDRRIGLFSAEKSYRAMIESALEKNIKVLLLGPSADKRCLYDQNERRKLDAHDAQIRSLADSYDVGFVDILALFDREEKAGNLDELLSHPYHPSRRGHALIADALFRWFPIPAIRPSRDFTPR